MSDEREINQPTGEIPMTYECIQSTRDGGWAVEAIDHAGDGAVSRVLFTGPDDEERALEYAKWKNSQT